MQQQLATKVCVSNKSGSPSPVEEVSQAVSMAGANCAQAEVTIITLAGTATPTITFTVQASNDLQNWTSLTPTSTMTTVGTKALSAVSAIGCAYVRMKYKVTAGTDVECCLAASLMTSSQ